MGKLGIVRKCGNRKRAATSFRVTKPTGPRPGHERRHPHERAAHSQVIHVKPCVGARGRVCLRARATVHPSAVGGSSHGVGGATEVRPAGSGGCARRVPQWARQAAAARADARHDHGPSAAGAGLAERFVSRVLPLFQRRTKQVWALLPQLYLHGLARGDFELALRRLLGEAAPLSTASLQRLKAQWRLEYEVWRQRRLEDREIVYVWADGLSMGAESP